MNIINSLMKKIGFCMIHLMGAVEGFLLSMFFSGSVFALVVAIISAVNGTPLFKIYFLGCVPFALVYFILLEVKLHKALENGKKTAEKARKMAEEHEKRMKQKEVTMNTVLAEEAEE